MLTNIMTTLGLASLNTLFMCNLMFTTMSGASNNPGLPQCTVCDGKTWICTKAWYKLHGIGGCDPSSSAHRAKWHKECPEDCATHAPRFRSALGSEYLTALVLHYAMYDREAWAKLTADPALGLAHFCRDPHWSHFVEEPGVEVTGANHGWAGFMYTEVNGWYRHREPAEGPPRTCSWTHEYWMEKLQGRSWFQKDDWSYIYWSSGPSPRKNEWWFSDSRGYFSYTTYAKSDTALPPAAGWIANFGELQSPTLRVVS